MNTFHLADSSLRIPDRPDAAHRSRLLNRVVATLLLGASDAAPAVVMPLARGSTHWVRRPLGREISCEAGTLWLAFDGEPRDIVLEAGQSHRCACASLLSIHALALSVVRVQ